MSTVRDLLETKNNELVAVAVETPVYDAVEKMTDCAVGTALVMEGQKLIGIVSERDFIRKVYLQKRDDQGMTVSDIMTTGLITVTPDHLLENCTTIMAAKRIRHLPVEDNGAVAGIISVSDIVRFLGAQKEMEIKSLQNYISEVDA